MSANRTPWRTLIICLCVLGLTPVISEANDREGKRKYKQSQKSFLEGERSPNGPLKRAPSRKHEKKRKSSPHSGHGQPRKHRPKKSKKERIINKKLINKYSDHSKDTISFGDLLKKAMENKKKKEEKEDNST